MSTDLKPQVAPKEENSNTLTKEQVGNPEKKGEGKEGTKKGLIRKFTQSIDIKREKKEERKKEEKEKRHKEKGCWLAPSVPSIMSGREKSWRTVYLDGDKEVDPDHSSKTKIALRDELFELQIYCGSISTTIQGWLDRAPYRILFLLGNYRIAHGYTLDDLSPYWNYLHQDMTQKMPDLANKKALGKWILEHIKTLEQQQEKDRKDQKKHEGGSPEAETQQEKSMDPSSAQPDQSKTNATGHNSVHTNDSKTHSSTSENSESLASSTDHLLVLDSPAKQQNADKPQDTTLAAPKNRGFVTGLQMALPEDLKKAANLKAAEDSSHKNPAQLKKEVKAYLKEIFGPEATHDQRTQKYFILVLPLLSLLLLIMRFCSFDLWIVLFFCVNGGVVYTLFRRTDVIVWLAKRKARSKWRMVETKSRRKLGFQIGGSANSDEDEEDEE